MRSILGIGFATLLAASLASGTSVPRTDVRGEYVEARTADVYTGPCFANGEVGIVGELAVFGWKIGQGEWQGTKLDGLSVVGVIRASSTLGDPANTAYPVKSVLIVDERANAEQRFALQGFAKRMSGDLLQDIVKVEYQPISFEVEGNNVHKASATLTAGSLAQIKTRAISAADDICHNEDVWYAPLTKVEHAMPAVATAHRFSGKGLDTTWSSPDKRSAFVANFHFSD